MSSRVQICRLFTLSSVGGTVQDSIDVRHHSLPTRLVLLARLALTARSHRPMPPLARRHQEGPRLPGVYPPRGIQRTRLSVASSDSSWVRPNLCGQRRPSCPILPRPNRRLSRGIGNPTFPLFPRHPPLLLVTHHHPSPQPVKKERA